LTAADGTELIPATLGGEIWRTDTFFGSAVSTFGICYNVDRIRELGLPGPPSRWEDLAAPAYAGQVGMGDPTKSGSLAKAFEMIVHEQCRVAVAEAGFAEADIDAFERAIARDGLPGAGADPRLAAYQAAVEAGWLRGIRLVQRMAANARYFTDSAGKVPIDVSMGSAAAGLAIDFYGRYQAETSRAPDGTPRMGYVTPSGGSSVSADPISLLRGAPHRELAVRFIVFALGDEGQKLWNYRPGTPGGPTTYALRRLPIRRDFYPSDSPAWQAACEAHRAHTADPLSDPSVNPYALGAAFTYRPRWTAGHFGVHRTLIKAMCLDAGDELRAAWRAVLAAGGPDACPEAMAALARMPDDPEPLTWSSAPGILKRHDPLDTARLWTAFFRRSYGEARRLADQRRGRTNQRGFCEDGLHQ
jgi:ABC-type Fe3+ transport system substrate-binding protein